MVKGKEKDNDLKVFWDGELPRELVDELVAICPPELVQVEAWHILPVGLKTAGAEPRVRNLQYTLLCPLALLPFPGAV